MTARNTDTEADDPVSLDSPEFLTDPFPFYDRLRRESPVYRTRMAYMGDTDVYLLSRYADCAELTTDRRFRRVVEGSAALQIPESLKFMATDSMILMDDPEHQRLRSLVSRAFTPAAVSRLAHRVDTVTRELLDGFSTGQRIDLIPAYALPIPVTVISEMVGVPAAERGRFHAAMELVIEGIGKYGIEKAAEKMESVIDYVRELIERRRNDPADDIMTGLIHAAEDGDTLTEDEVVAMVFLLVTAGYETTYNLIANGVHALLSHPDQLERLKANPELIGTAVEEILRFTGTIGGTKPNYAGDDVELHGIPIPRGAMVIPLLASANRDPEVFDNPDVFDIGRDPNYHMAFSKGSHFCLGANLARMETRVAITNLITQFPGLQLAVEPSELQMVPMPFWRRLTALPVILN